MNIEHRLCEAMSVSGAKGNSLFNIEHRMIIIRKSWTCLIINFIVISLIQLTFSSCCTHNKANEVLVSKKELSNIKKCLSKTIIELNQKKAIRGFKINIKSLEGTSLKQDEKNIFLGDWSIEFKNNIVVASYSISASTHEDEMLFIEMKKVSDNYTVVKWYVMNFILD